MRCERLIKWMMWIKWIEWEIVKDGLKKYIMSGRMKIKCLIIVFYVICYYWIYVYIYIYSCCLVDNHYYWYFCIRYHSFLFCRYSDINPVVNKLFIRQAYHVCSLSACIQRLWDLCHLAWSTNGEFSAILQIKIHFYILLPHPYHFIGC